MEMVNFLNMNTLLFPVLDLTSRLVAMFCQVKPNLILLALIKTLERNRMSDIRSPAFECTVRLERSDNALLYMANNLERSETNNSSWSSLAIS